VEELADNGSKMEGLCAGYVNNRGNEGAISKRRGEGPENEPEQTMKRCIFTAFL